MANNTPSSKGLQAIKVGDEHLELSFSLGHDSTTSQKNAYDVMGMKITKSTIFLKLKQQQRHA
jgi:hypothetical protein